MVAQSGDAVKRTGWKITAGADFSMLDVTGHLEIHGKPIVFSQWFVKRLWYINLLEG